MIATTPSSAHGLEVSPYTRSMAQCLDGLADARQAPLAYSEIHVLMNMVQGRMLEFLAEEICRARGIQDPQSKQCIVRALLGIFSDEFFALFRSKIQKRPDLVVLIARRIIRGEYESRKAARVNGNRRPNARLFPAIFRKYFEYRNLDSLLRMVESDAEIQKIILLSLLRRKAQAENPELYREILQILEEDREGICPNLFMEYITDKGLDTLLERIRSGAWRVEMEGLKERIAELRGE